MALSVCFESDKTVGKSGANRTVNGDIAVVIFKIDTAPDHSVEAKDILIIHTQKLIGVREVADLKQNGAHIKIAKHLDRGLGLHLFNIQLQSGVLEGNQTLFTAK